MNVSWTVRIALAVGTGWLTPIAAQAPIDSGTAAAARQLIELMDVPRLALAGMEANIPALKLAMPQTPDQFWTEMLELAKRDLGQLVDSITPLYARRFSLPELQALIAFYQSPAGKRLVQIQPALVKESTEIGQRWGAKIGAEAAQRLSAKPPPA